MHVLSKACFVAALKDGSIYQRWASVPLYTLMILSQRPQYSLVDARSHYYLFTSSSNISLSDS